MLSQRHPRLDISLNVFNVSLSEIITRLRTNGGSIQKLTVCNNNNVGADLGDLPATIDPCQPTSPTYPDPPIYIPNPPFKAISMREWGTRWRNGIWSCRCTSRSEGKFTNTTLVDFFCKRGNDFRVNANEAVYPME